jgi:integrase
MPSNYFARYKRVLNAATLQGYFTVSPGVNLPVRSNKNKKKKKDLEVNEYVQLLRTHSRNQEIKEAFILCCYTGLRWCDIKQLTWGQLKEDSIILAINQKKTTVGHFITLHPIARQSSIKGKKGYMCLKVFITTLHAVICNRILRPLVHKDAIRPLN